MSGFIQTTQNCIRFIITAVRNFLPRLENILGSAIMTSSTQIPTFCRNVLLPYLGWKMGAIVSFRMLKMLVPMYQTTRHHIPEDHHLNIHYCENLNIKLPVITKTHMSIMMNIKTCFSNIRFSAALTSKSMSSKGFFRWMCSVHKMHKLKPPKGYYHAQCLSSPLSYLWNHWRYFSIVWYNESMLKSVPQIGFWLTCSLYYVLYRKWNIYHFSHKYPHQTGTFGMYREGDASPTSTCWLHEKNPYRNQNISTLQFSPFPSIF